MLGSIVYEQFGIVSFSISVSEIFIFFIYERQTEKNIFLILKKLIF